MPAKGPSILIGALVYTVLSVLTAIVMTTGGGMGASALGCVAILAASVVAVAHYTATHRLTIPAGQGAGLGAVATLVGVVVAFGVGLLLQELGITPSTEEMIEMQRADMEARGMEPEQVDQAMGMAESMSSPLIALGFSLVVGAVVGAVGGAVSAMIFKKGEAVA